MNINTTDIHIFILTQLACETQYHKTKEKDFDKLLKLIKQHPN